MLLAWHILPGASSRKTLGGVLSRKYRTFSPRRSSTGSWLERMSILETKCFNCECVKNCSYFRVRMIVYARILPFLINAGTLLMKSLDVTSLYTIRWSQTSSEHVSWNYFKQAYIMPTCKTNWSPLNSISIRWPVLGHCFQTHPLNPVSYVPVTTYAHQSWTWCCSGPTVRIYHGRF